MARHFATIQKKTANSADSGGRPMISQSIDLWRQAGYERARKAASMGYRA
jgi:hypothetical protein